MTRVSPPEEARELPGPQASTSVTLAPRRRSIKAVHPPNAPAPTTTTRVPRGGGAVFPRALPRRATVEAPASPEKSRRRERPGGLSRFFGFWDMAKEETSL